MISFVKEWSPFVDLILAQAEVRFDKADPKFNKGISLFPLSLLVLVSSLVLLSSFPLPFPPPNTFSSSTDVVEAILKDFDVNWKLGMEEIKKNIRKQFAQSPITSAQMLELVLEHLHKHYKQLTNILYILYLLLPRSLLFPVSTLTLSSKRSF